MTALATRDDFPSDTQVAVGERFHRWVVLKRTSRSMALCRCDCGTEREVYQYRLIEDASRSCGCWKRDKANALKFIPTNGDTISPAQLAERSGMKPDAAQQALCRLLKRGRVERVGFGQYRRKAVTP
jgi:hypothetical protein